MFTSTVTSVIHWLSLLCKNRIRQSSTLPPKRRTLFGTQAAPSDTKQVEVTFTLRWVSQLPFSAFALQKDCVYRQIPNAFELYTHLTLKFNISLLNAFLQLSSSVLLLEVSLSAAIYSMSVRSVLRWSRKQFLFYRTLSGHKMPRTAWSSILYFVLLTLALWL